MPEPVIGASPCPKPSPDPTFLFWEAPNSARGGVDPNMSGTSTCQRLRSLSIEAINAAHAGDCTSALAACARICELDPIYLHNTLASDADVSRCLHPSAAARRCVANATGAGAWDADVSAN